MTALTLPEHFIVAVFRQSESPYDTVTLRCHCGFETSERPLRASIQRHFEAASIRKAQNDAADRNDLNRRIKSGEGSL